MGRPATQAELAAAALKYGGPALAMSTVEAETESATVQLLRHILAQWEPRVTCPRCGGRYTSSPCDDAHRVVQNAIFPPAG